jgi:hypothetical protein
MMPFNAGFLECTPGLVLLLTGWRKLSVQEPENFAKTLKQAKLARVAKTPVFHFLPMLQPNPRRLILQPLPLSQSPLWVQPYPSHRQLTSRLTSIQSGLRGCLLRHLNLSPGRSRDLFSTKVKNVKSKAINTVHRPVILTTDWIQSNRLKLVWL